VRVTRQGGFRSAVLEIVGDVPPGSVMTYGDVAAVLGSGGARAVGRVMATSDGMPWWRVVRSTGHPALGHEDAALDRTTRHQGIPSDVAITRPTARAPPDPSTAATSP
jgi:alkylated DNA nucleotide flippase Atl1